MSTSSPERVIPIHELNRAVSKLLEGHFSRVWVRGEVSNFTRAASGHWYFTIKDDRAAARAVMFRSRAAAVGFVPKAGECFDFFATVGLYEPRGDFQIQVEALRRAGQGNLHEAFLALKQKLEAEGLFDPGRKLSIPSMPRRVGVITSLAAAALRDVLAAMARRAPHVQVVLYPAPVQGADASGRLLEALRVALQRDEVDVILLVRGGGSLEDLWSFNDEALARAVAASHIPIISGVGHETDFTIADFVADLRAPTPTAAAELCCRSRQECLDAAQAAFLALTAQQYRNMERAALRLDRAVAMLVSPQQRVQYQRERLHGLHQRLMRCASSALDRRRPHLDLLLRRLGHAEPAVEARRRTLEQTIARLVGCAPRQMAVQQARVLSAVQTLEALNPRKILHRGYAIVRDEQGRLVKNALDLNRGDRLSLELGQGGADVKVVATRSLL